MTLIPPCCARGCGVISGTGDLLNTCSCVPTNLQAHALRPWYYTASREQRRVLQSQIERVVAGGGPSGVLLRGKGIENYSRHLGTI